MRVEHLQGGLFRPGMVGWNNVCSVQHELDPELGLGFVLRPGVGGVQSKCSFWQLMLNHSVLCS